ncbi:acyl-CoA dehydrogenase family protein [Nocardia sp. CA-135953]|uniref:acyl-CoA dehydrogenase family protein n=1 Tax=Nocardia sp. CA-135953 TaxID=3239978 RepID=UPI003D95A5C9
MSPDLSEDIRAAVRATFIRHDPREHGSGAWEALAQQIGVTGLFVPEALGGAGLGSSEMALVAQELGRTAAKTPFLSTAVLATTVALAAEDGPLRADTLSWLLEGKTVVAVAVAETDGTWHVHQPTTTARESGAGWTIDGVKQCVVDGAAADLYFVFAETSTGAAWFVIDGGAPGVRRTPADAFDLTRDLATVTFTDSPASILIGPDRAAEVVWDTARQGLLAVAADQIGVADRALQLAVEHAKSRSQFGKVIGSFQAIKHLCADVLLEVELARAAVDSAALAGDDARIALAHLCAARAAISATEASIRIHGGIGFTWEHEAHLYLRRARMGAVLFGPLDEYRDAIARSAGLPGRTSVSPY